MYHPRHSLLFFLLIPLTALIASLQANNAANTAPSEPLRDSLDKIRWRAQSGDAYYQGYLGICHRTGYKDAELSKTKARHWSQLSAKQMHPLGLANMGAVCLWESQKLSGNKEAHRRKVIEARQYYEDAYLNGLYRLAEDGGSIGRRPSGRLLSYQQHTITSRNGEVLSSRDREGLSPQHGCLRGLSGWWI